MPIPDDMALGLARFGRHDDGRSVAMQIMGTEGYLPIQKKTTTRLTGAAGGRRVRTAGGLYDQVAVSSEQERTGFRELAASLSYQVRTYNTTGKIQELRRQVTSGEYQVEPRETAARMLLLMEEGE